MWKKTKDSMAANWAKEGYGKPKPQNPEDLKPLRGPATKNDASATAKGRENLRSKVILRGNHGGGKVVFGLDASGTAPLSKTDLDLMERNYKRYVRTGHLAFPFKMPAKYDDKSGAPEAVDEIVSLRGTLKQDQKTGKIAIPEGTKISKKARELINEWNSLDMSTVYVNSVMGNRLNVSGLGVQAGPRNSVPKDAIRGLVQYVGLRRQQAELEDTPDGKRITSYRDPWTGQRRPYMIGNSVVASQDHWERPFGIYGIRSENDVRNTVYMPASMNSNKGEASPGRYLFQLLNKNGRLTDGFAADGNAVGGFRARYDKDPKKDFLPRGITRDSEKLALAEKAQWMIDKANTQVNSKVVPKIEKALQGEVTAAQAAALIKDIAKHESKTNYFGGDLRFGNGARIMTPYEQNLVKGIKLEGSTGKLQTNIQAAIEASGKTPKQILQEVLQNRQGYTPTATGSAPGPTTPKAVKETKPAKPPTTKNLTEDQKEKVSMATKLVNSRIDQRLNEGQLYDAKTNAEIKKGNQQVLAPFEKMSANEKAALNMYGENKEKYYLRVNSLLRNGDFEGSTPEGKQMAQFIAGNLRSGLEKLPPAKVEELNRAVSGGFTTALGKLKPGDVIEDKGFGSYTDSKTKGRVLDTFFKRDQPNAVIRIVNPKTIREVAPAMPYKTEGEHISLPGTKYRLVDVNDKVFYSGKTMSYIPQYTFEEI
jgi:hypothetical protein